MIEGIKISLTLAERAFLLMISQRGNDVTMDYNSLSKESIEGIERLEKKEVITRIKLIGQNSYIHKLTSSGINLVDLIKERNT